ncbi:efflux RND transporter periplasmic adaptor subunit [Catenuloplanes atrovinosus]|uniref:Macrolide-specific efflux system membrane fusion protein n=1 Tax=Catenuloplanes atrovinosus TaxID=137266 RepID=A0AAE3YWB3_9ACTN|nr:HlyD family efflux transporter periplasmic adaptor subunit [Catenuloplanes atrovinosus]MDR7279775.1 macrolide-specific efflux system membrane fusion protein [Catenuloplanes atrovinosus]
MGLGVWAYFSLAQPARGEASTTAGTTRTLTVQQGTVTSTVSADGTVESATTAGASFGTSGTVTEIAVKVGDTVTKGQVLAKLDPAAANRSLEAARADLTAAQDALARAEAEGSDTTSAEAEVTRAELAVEEAADAVAGTTLTATMDGTVITINGSIGGTASGSGGQTGQTGQSGGSDQSTDSGGAFAEIADLNALQVTASFAEADATKLEEGQTATVTWNALTGVTATATVAAIDPHSSGDGGQDSSVTYGATLSLDEVPEGAKSGQTVTVAVTTGTAANVVMVNSAAITSAGRGHTVTTVVDGQQVSTPVEIGLEGDTMTEITSGLAVGDQVLYTIEESASQQGGGGQFPAGGGFPAGGTQPGGAAQPGGGMRGGGQ